MVGALSNRVATARKFLEFVEATLDGVAGLVAVGAERRGPAACQLGLATAAALAALHTARWLGAEYAPRRRFAEMAATPHHTRPTRPWSSAASHAT
jgi:hypothetical protein